MKKIFNWLPRTFIGLYFFWILIVAVVFVLDDYRTGDLIHYILLLLVPPLSVIALYVFKGKK
jgi:hypothetical protein